MYLWHLVQACNMMMMIMNHLTDERHSCLVVGFDSAHVFVGCACNEVKWPRMCRSGRSESSSCLEGIEPHVEQFQANV